MKKILFLASFFSMYVIASPIVSHAQTELRSENPLKINEIRFNPSEPKTGELLTLHIDLDGTWNTPFWQEEIALDVEFQGPGGKTWSIPGFYTRDFQRTRDDSGDRPVEVLTPIGQAEWQVRFLPNFAGNYQVTVRAADRNGEIEQIHTITVSEGMPKPYIRVSNNDPHYFEFENGEPYFAIGLNVAWGRGGTPTYDFERWFTDMGDAGANFARVWMGQRGFLFESVTPGTYSLNSLWQMDHVLSMAAENGVYIKLCLEDYRNLSRNNPYSKENGGPCETVRDFFKDPEAKRMWKNRLRYTVARWGWSPNIMAWEFWNEIDASEGYDKPVVQSWTKEMAQYLDHIDPYHHLHVNSLGSFAFEPRLWMMPEMDFAQMHGYWRPNWISGEFGKDWAQVMIDRIAILRPFQKPSLFAEFGLVDERWYYSPLMDIDTGGVNMHNGMWAAILAGSAGCGHLWWWDEYVAPQNLWYHYRGVANFAAGVPWNTQGFEPFQIDTRAAPYDKDVDAEQLRIIGLRGKTMTLLWIQNRANTWLNVVEKNPVPPVENARVYFPEFSCQESNIYTVEIWDTYTGSKLSTRKVIVNGETPFIELGRLEKDVAVKILLD
jgi:hypothetical protein